MYFLQNLIDSGAAERLSGLRNPHKSNDTDSTTRYTNKHKISLLRTISTLRRNCGDSGNQLEAIYEETSVRGGREEGY